MSFLSLIVRNLLRHRVRTSLTAIGIGAGIAAIVALGVIAASLKTTVGEIIKVGGADFLVVQEGAADLSFSTVSEEDWLALSQRDGVEIAQGALFDITQVGDNPYFFLLGRRAEDIQANPPPLIQGTLWTAEDSNTVLLGKIAAADLGVSVGGTVTIDRREFTVTGVYETGRAYEDRGGYAPLTTVQEVTSRPGVVTGVYITVEGGSDPAEVAREIEATFPNLTTVSNVGETSKVDQGVEILDAVDLAISVLAIGIGAIGVMNTMIMSVFERTREIGILRAVGWSGERIIRMILGESLVLCVIGAVLGTTLGILATRALLLIDLVRNLMVPEYPQDIFVRAFVVALVVALTGALYPAFRAVHLKPLEALRYE
jgi:putative ABC transport system permease protein